MFGVLGEPGRGFDPETPPPKGTSFKQTASFETSCVMRANRLNRLVCRGLQEEKFKYSKTSF
jgi:hypothetical protein